jgi:hypothetical protein
MPFYLDCIISKLSTPTTPLVVSSSRHQQETYHDSQSETSRCRHSILSNHTGPLALIVRIVFAHRLHFMPVCAIRVIGALRRVICCQLIVHRRCKRQRDGHDAHVVLMQRHQQHGPRVAKGEFFANEWWSQSLQAESNRVISSGRSSSGDWRRCAQIHTTHRIIESTGMWIGRWGSQIGLRSVSPTRVEL